MKPPPRFRVKPVTCVLKEKKENKWQLREQKELIAALKILKSRHESTTEDIDYGFIAERLPNRSESEIQSCIESLTNKVITIASTTVKQQQAGKETAKQPIEGWTCLASQIAGTLEESISSAFSRMLTVSSTEPLTLKNNVPLQIINEDTDQDITCLPDPGSPSGTNYTDPPMLHEYPSLNSPIGEGQNGRNSLASQVPSAASHLEDSGTCTPQFLNPGSPATDSAFEVEPQSIHITQDGSKQPSGTTSDLSPSSSPHAAMPSSATVATPYSNTSPSSSVTSSSSAPFNSSTQAIPTSPTLQRASSKRVNSKRKKDVSKTCTDKRAVNFENIYRYLSVTDKPDEKCHLTPMESAIVLNLLMSLQEQLSLLDYTAFHKHLTQITKLFKSLRKRVDAQRDKKSSGSTITTVDDDNIVGTDDSAGATDGGHQHLTDGHSSETDATSDSDEADMLELFPPLNPFVVPVTLLRRKNLTSATASSPD